ncbi:MAG: type II and III secretion system protein family protein [Planctomycetes bacterium]|nr:type II and III secretion system protein family protein [Planctomycetota bacterium]
MKSNLLSVLMAVGVMVGAPIAYAGGFDITVREVEESAAHIIVPLRGSMVVETTEPASRVQIIESAIAKVESLSPKQYLVTGVGYGMTQMIVWSESGERKLIDVQVELDVRLLNEKLRDLDPQADAVATSIMGNIVLTGTVSGAASAERMERFAALFVSPDAQSPETLIQNHLQVAGQQQVLLRCTVAEVSRSAARELGINGFLGGENLRDMFTVSQIGGFNPINIGAAADTAITGTIPFLTGNQGIPLAPTSTLSFGFPRVQMQVFLKAMADNSLLKILAEPNLVAISGETASFLAGGEFPIPVPQSGSAAGSVTIQFREFGIKVDFTPVVLAHQRIRMRVAPEVSETDFSNAIQIQGFVVPGLTQRRVETTVEVGNGQTLAIAGLLSEEVRGLASALPGLGDVPVLGALFRSTSYRRRESELVILVTPEIIAPMNPHQVPDVPGHDYLPPNDYELYALGQLEGEIPDEEGEVLEDTRSPYRTHGEPKVAPFRGQSDDMSSIKGPWGYSTNDDG